MGVPMDYRYASRDFEALLSELRDHAMLQTTHQAYTMLEAVLLVLRRRLTVGQGVAFANLLPPMLRAMFVTDWDPEQAVLPFAPADAWMAEVKGLRHNHNLSTDRAIADVTDILKRHITAAALADFLAGLPPEAQGFFGR